GAVLPVRSGVCAGKHGVRLFNRQGVLARWGKEGGEVDLNEPVALEVIRELADRAVCLDPFPEVRGAERADLSSVRMVRREAQVLRDAEANGDPVGLLAVADRRWLPGAAFDEIDRRFELVTVLERDARLRGDSKPPDLHMRVLRVGVEAELLYERAPDGPARRLEAEPRVLARGTELGAPDELGIRGREDRPWGDGRRD